jgi:uncharacterized protein (DUF58 family)
MGISQRLNLKRFTQGEGPEAGPITLTQRRIYILPTKQGIFFAVLMLVMLMGSINYNNSLGYTLTFLLASLSIVAILHTYRNLLHLRVDVGHINPVFAGEVLRVPCILDNAHHSARYALKLEFPKQGLRTVHVPARDWTRLALPLANRHRGRHPLPRITLHTLFPLGLFHAWSHVQFPQSYLIYPRPSPHRLPLQESPQPSERQGDKGKGADDFAGLRNYYHSDSPRHVHWKAAARGQGLYTKQFGGDQQDELWLDWQALPNLDTESRISQLTRWVLDAEEQQHRYGLRLPDKIIPLGHGPQQRHACLEALALFQNREQPA